MWYNVINEGGPHMKNRDLIVDSIIVGIIVFTLYSVDKPVWFVAKLIYNVAVAEALFYVFKRFMRKRKAKDDEGGPQ